MSVVRIVVLSLPGLQGLLLLSATTCLALEYEYSGHLRGQTTLAWYEADHLLTLQEDRRLFVDGSLDLRLNGNIYFRDRLKLQLGYEAAGAGGQNRRALARRSSGANSSALLNSSLPSDDRQLFDLTAVSSGMSGQLAYHRIDRLLLSFDSDLGTFKFGRQALTWGNGLVFNPADLINPFGPTDIIRDYKAGTDMFLYQGNAGFLDDFQLVLVPRRDVANGRLESSLTTFGSKIRLSRNELDLDLLALRNYQDMVIGAGLTGFVGGAVYRTDWTVTFLKDGSRDSFVSGVANLDFSWVLQERNWYGSVELYYNGLGVDNLNEVQQNQVLVDRLAKGEMFVTGRWYLSGAVQYEAHPLVNCFVSTIFNLQDQSFFLQPRLVWDLSQSSQLLVGVNLPVGGTGDEFGDQKDVQTGIVTGPASQGYMVFTWYF